MERDVKLGIMLFGFGVGLAMFFAAAWVTHIIWVIGKLAGPVGITGGQIALALLGTFVPPIGVIHGVLIWFGAGF